ncbi:MAG: hypothetical protein ABSA68_12170 [Xanthobacteraceae bacterium]|jgi:hypothetical protein
MTGKKRKYVRNSLSTWSEICALWEIGDVTLPELAERYSVSTRTLQAHFGKREIIKGSKAAAMAAAVMTEVFKSEMSDQGTVTHRAKETRDLAYTNATIIEGLVMAQLSLAQKDPTQAHKAATAVKTLSLAAATLERTQAVKWRALGLDRENALPDEMPVLIFRDLGKDELEALQKRDEADEESDLGIPIAPAGSELGLTATESEESDDIVEEGRESEDADIILEGVDVFIEGDDVIVGSDERDDLAKLCPKPLAHPGGGRLVKDALP